MNLICYGLGIIVLIDHELIIIQSKWRCEETFEGFAV